jgi:hypothetical protein
MGVVEDIRENVAAGSGQKAINRVLDSQDATVDEVVVLFLERARAARHEYSTRLGQLDAAHNADLHRLVPGFDAPELTQAEFADMLLERIKVDAAYTADSANAAHQYRMDIYSASDALAEAMIAIL